MSDNLVETGTVNSTPKSDNKMMASFRIDRDGWKRFGELGKRERLTVTELITDYVEKCLAADRSWYGVEISTGKDDVSIGHSPIISTGNDDVLKQVDQRIREAIEPLQVEVERLGRQFASLHHPLSDIPTDGIAADNGASIDKLPKPSTINDGLNHVSRLELNKFREKPQFLAAVREAIDKCGSNIDICRHVLESGFGRKNNTEEYDIGYVARWKNAIEVIDRETNSTNLG